MRTLGLEVVPVCPFIAAYIRSHANDYLDLVVPAMREPFGRGRQADLTWLRRLAADDVRWTRMLPHGSPTTGEVLSP